MSKFWNARVRGLSPYVPGEQPRDRRYIKLNTNENPYPPSASTVEAIKTAAADTLRLYPDPTCLELREAIAEHYRVKIDQVFVGNGSDEILGMAFGAFFGENAEPLLFPDISYSFYPVYADLWGVKYRKIPLRDDFSIRIEDYLHPSGGVVFPNPNAPTGLALPLPSVLDIVDYHFRSGQVVLVDEAYVDFGAESAVSAIRDYPNLLTVHTLSKSRSLAGLRAGFAIGHEELIEGLNRIKDSFNSYTLDRCALAGATAAIRDSAYYGDINRRVVATRERTAASLRSLGFQMPESKANFLFARHPSLKGEDLFRALRERGILVRHFDKPRIADYLRISIGTDEEMDALVSACAELVKR